jgi:hypothetical protein
MALGVVPWRARRLARSAPAVSRRRERTVDAAASRDPFLDAIVLLSVLMFLVLVIGIGVLVLQATFNHIPG